MFYSVQKRIVAVSEPKWLVRMMRMIRNRFYRELTERCSLQAGKMNESILIEFIDTNNAMETKSSSKIWDGDINISKWYMVTKIHLKSAKYYNWMSNVEWSRLSRTTLFIKIDKDLVRFYQKMLLYELSTLNHAFHEKNFIETFREYLSSLTFLLSTCLIDRLIDAMGGIYQYLSL